MENPNMLNELTNLKRLSKTSTRDVEQEEEEAMPVSPMGQFVNSKSISISIVAVIESQVPIHDVDAIVKHVEGILPTNPRFTSVMVTGNNGVKEWKKVKINIMDHVTIPMFRAGESLEFYEGEFNKYLSKISLEELPRERPLWELHIIMYPTRSVAGNVVFKLHHSLGDGFSLMGVLLSCFKRADNPNLPLTFPSIRGEAKPDFHDHKQGIFSGMGKGFSLVYNTIIDFGFGLVKSSLVDDGRTSLRSGDSGVEFQPIDICTIIFGLDQLKQIKANLQVTMNDVIMGIIFLGTSLYMKEIGENRGKDSSTALLLLNTRNINSYSSVEEMVNPDKDNNTKWGNHFGFLHVSLPHLTSSNPLEYVFEAHRIIKRKRSSAVVLLSGKFLELLRKYRGTEVAASYLYKTINNSTMSISNLIGPVEQCSLANHPCPGMYFMVVGTPQNLTITMISYMGKMRIAVGTKGNHINSQKYKACMETAFDIVYKTALL
ncbi:wax ester synthase/diacylglycerol acyltransferase 11-like [Impatiens glandulifera]|uniref:wax ester synthase/diacylglycerol acyltransferase 11-like n=1 Tax=Impatiens glandulifera TaxID=253017 RepID=UPI001FB18622|nr:wax ester synthase/diacylglycerol acyltransferase 11-like [Impatiens glandulifera]